MCTLSWIDTRTDLGRGREVFFNRDERRTRGPERAPFVWRSGPIPFLAPQDPDGGGTWCAVNAAGVAVTLLNGYHARRAAARSAPRSRGLLVRDLAGSLASCDWPTELDPDPYEPFVLVLLRTSQVVAYRWDGARLEREDEPCAPFVSSSVTPESVRPHRERLWREWSQGSPPSHRDAALAYHRHAPEGGDAHSPSMRRDDACTRSLCHLVVEPDEVRLAYTPGPPHVTDMEAPLRLERLTPGHP